MTIKNIKIWLVAIIFISACSTGINIFTDSDEVQLGKQFDSEIRKNTKEYPIYDNQEVKEYIDKNIFREILKSPEIKKRDVYNYQIEIIDNDSTLNAFALPGGYIYLYTGLLKYLDSEAALAGVIGHEIAHAIARHGNERMSQQLLAATGGLALDVALINKPAETRQLFNTAYGVGANLGVLLPYSRLHETEADKLGLIFMAMAGYNPAIAPDFWKRMAAVSGNKVPEILSTHPSNETRIHDLNKFMPTAMKYYKPRP